MAKRKKFEVELNEVQSNQDDQTLTDVVINQQVAGQIREIDNKEYEATFNNKKTVQVHRFDEAIEFIIREYNLHGLS